MSVYILWEMDDEAIRWQKCAICNQQNQRIVREPGKPNFAMCNTCGSAFVLEKGGKMRMLYGSIPRSLPETYTMGYKKWRTYFEIRAAAEREIQPSKTPSPKPGQLPAVSSDPYMDLEAQKSEMMYNRAKRLDKPPRQLKDTGELPPLENLFENLDE
jgi:hypothetical protein